MSVVYTLTHYDTHFGTDIEVYATAERALAEAERRLAEHETDRHGTEYVERRDSGIWHVGYGPEGAYILVEKREVRT